MGLKSGQILMSSKFKCFAVLSVPGLHHDDCYDEDNPDVKEAIRRLPAHLVDERNFRVTRAMQLSLQKIILPKEEWVKFEEVSMI
jgi:ubiquinol-cytochrome c reductase subunit 7